jgi:ubiquinone/menaquinone biosynthesis C-methylase UbiE
MDITPELRESVRRVGAHWVDSSYYDDAEKWTFLFWRDDTIFNQYFEELSLGVVVELACGHGRHAEKIVDRVRSLILMDIHDKNLEVCQNRLSGSENVTFLKSSGYNFEPIAIGSISSIFCYDAMVHFSQDMIASYLIDTARVLESGGKALYHHSNYEAPAGRSYGQNPQARNHMTQPLFAELARRAGLRITRSTVIDWGGVKDLDCLTLLTKP